MKFEEALKLLKEGKRLTRKEWSRIYLAIRKNELIKYCYKGFMLDSFELSSDDILADDWQIYEI